VRTQTIPPRGANARGARDIESSLDVLGLTRQHIAALGACAVGFGADLLSVGLGAALSAVFSSQQHHVESGSLALLLSAPFCGAVVGAPLIGGWFGYRFGPKRSLTWALLLLAIASIGCALATPIAALIAFRVLTGVALGGFSPLMFTYLSEVLPPASRGSWTAVVVAVGLLGVPLGIGFVRALEGSALGLEPWRMGFVLGAGGAAGGALAFLKVPESPRWLAARGRRPEAELAYGKFADSTPIFPGRLAGAPHGPGVGTALSITQMLTLAGLFFIGPWATTGFPLLVGAVFIAEGFALPETLTYVAIATLGPTIATLIAAPLLERISRRRAIACSSAVMAISLLVFALAHTPLVMVAASLVFQIAESLYLTVLVILTPESFTTVRRAAGVSTAWGLNRLGATLAPLALVPFLHARGPTALLMLLAGACVVLLALSLASPAGHAQQSL